MQSTNDPNPRDQADADPFRRGTKQPSRFEERLRAGWEDEARKAKTAGGQQTTEKSANKDKRR